MGQKIILVTGSSKGIGFEIVRQLSQLGHKVILSSRNETKGLEALKKLEEENLKVHFAPMDIISESSVEKCFQKIKTDFGKLDVIVNNAAILMKEDQSLLKNSNDITEQTLNNNAYAQLRVTKKFLPLLSKGACIIMTSSQGGSMSDAVGGWSPAYCVSKSLLNAMTRHLAHELSHKEIYVNAYDPGWVRTDMGGRSAPRSVEQGADTAVWLATSEKKTTAKFYRNRQEISW